MEIELQHETRIVDFEFSDVPITECDITYDYFNKNMRFLNNYQYILNLLITDPIILFRGSCRPLEIYCHMTAISSHLYIKLQKVFFLLVCGARAEERILLDGIQ